MKLVSAMGLNALLLLSFTGNLFAHTYRISGVVNTGVLIRSGLIEHMDEFSTNEVSNPGNLSLIISDSNTKKEILKLKSEFGSPTFIIDKIVEIDSSYLSLDLTLVDQDYTWLMPWTWGTGLSDDKSHLLSLSISPEQNQAINTFVYTKSQVTRFSSIENNLINFEILDTDNGSVLTSKSLTKNEYQEVRKKISGEGYRLEITRVDVPTIGF